MFLGEIQGLGLEVLPESAGQRNVIAARGQSFEKESFQPGLLFALLRIPEQRAEILADVAVALCGELFMNSSPQRATATSASISARCSGMRRSAKRRPGWKLSFSKD